MKAGRENVPRRRHALLALALTALVGAATTASAGAATITPDTFADDNTINGNCTLREAVIAANANAAQDGCTAGSGADIISLAAGPYVLSVPGADENAAATGDLDINEDLEVTGQGSAQTSVDGGALDAVFHNDALGGPVGAVSTIADLTIRNGANPEDFEGGAITNSTLGTLTLLRGTVADSVASGGFVGGGIHNVDQATLTIRESTVSGNDATDPFGFYSAGGILNLNQGRLTIVDSTISGNTAASGYSGGGITNLNEGVLSVERSTVSANAATYDDDNTSGGGLMNLNDGVLTIRNSTVSGNTSAVAGGGILNQNQATLSLRSSTVARNSTGTSGGGIFDGTDPGMTTVPPFLSVQGSIVAENTAAGAAQNCALGDSSPGIRSDGHNLEDLATCGFAAVGDLQNATAGLGALAANGGATQTHLPALASAAIDAGLVDGLTSDQRGLVRTADLSLVPNGAGDGTDIGAVELQVATCRGEKVPRIDGTDAGDSLRGSGAAEAIFGLAGKDKVSAKGGNDCVDGGAGKDKLKGGPGKDKIKPGGGKDKINCGGGKDKVNASPSDQVAGNCEKVT